MGQEPLVSYRSVRTKYLNLLASGLLWPLEVALERRAKSDDSPICFIVGPPRSGTTLLYEMVVTQFQCSYLSNLAKRLFRVPVAATWLCRNAIRNRRGSFDSVYGELEGNAAPNEAGRIWHYWMPYAAPYFLDKPGLTPDRMRRKMAAICRLTGWPMVIKNPILQSDMSQIATSFPNAVFLHIERDWSDNARSLMKLRQDRKSSDGTGWVSLRPEGWEHYADADALAQSCAQVILSHKDIVTHLDAAQTQGKVMKIDYERLCADPDEIFAGIEAFFRDNGIDVVRKPEAGTLRRMSPRRQPDDETRSRIASCLQEISGSIAS
ncbi:sulfotransferase [Roseovarius pacificus]|uniref:sulfotransferase n=1 Tax=Roseovarius pacificus TaxID=337701 RepID=UPI002A1869D5|nr:sulfotransferase [Roseovarius pacificus]